MKRRCIVLYLLLFAVLNSSAQYGPVGFVNYNDGINGITGGSAGEVVRVTNRQDLATYAGIGNVILPDALDQHAPIYDLSGRRIPSTNPRPGIYILRGKKFVVK